MSPVTDRLRPRLADLLCRVLIQPGPAEGGPAVEVLWTLDAVLDQNPAGEAMRSIEIVLRHYHRDPGVALPHQIPVTVLLRENLPLSD